MVAGSSTHAHKPHLADGIFSLQVSSSRPATQVTKHAKVFKAPDWWVRNRNVSYPRGNVAYNVVMNQLLLEIVLKTPTFDVALL